jgi:hypothetical protein
MAICLQRIEARSVPTTISFVLLKPLTLSTRAIKMILQILTTITRI